MSWTIFNKQGQRKYLTRYEVDAFVKSSGNYPIEIRIFCCMLAFSGCRISEALSLTDESIDFEAQSVVIKCLKKKRKNGVSGNSSAAPLFAPVKTLVHEPEKPAVLFVDMVENDGIPPCL